MCKQLTWAFIAFRFPWKEFCLCSLIAGVVLMRVSTWPPLWLGHGRWGSPRLLLKKQGSQWSWDHFWGLHL